MNSRLLKSLIFATGLLSATYVFGATSRPEPSMEGVTPRAGGYRLVVDNNSDFIVHVMEGDLRRGIVRGDLERGYVFTRGQLKDLRLKFKYPETDYEKVMDFSKYVEKSMKDEPIEKLSVTVGNFSPKSTILYVPYADIMVSYDKEERLIDIEIKGNRLPEN